jgi:hypothetical protein
MANRRTPTSLPQSTQELLNRARAAIETRRITLEDCRVRQNAFEERRRDFDWHHHLWDEAS